MTTPETGRAAGCGTPGAVIPGSLLRGALAAAGLAAVALIAPGIPGGLIVILAAGVLVAARWPDTVVPLLLIGAVIVVRIATAAGAIDGVTLALEALLPLIHQLAGVAAVMAPRSTVELAALRPALARYLAATVPVLVAGVVLLAAS